MIRSTIELIQAIVQKMGLNSQPKHIHFWFRWDDCWLYCKAIVDLLYVCITTIVRATAADQLHVIEWRISL